MPPKSRKKEVVEAKPELRPPFTSSGLNTLLKEASGIRRLGEGAAEMAEQLGTLLMAKAAAQAGEKARVARRTTLFKEDVESGFKEVLEGVFAEPPTPTPETLFAAIQSLKVDEVKALGRLLSEWAVASKAARKETVKQRTKAAG